MGFFRNLFGKKRDPEIDLEKRVGEYLLNLPRCSRNVVIVSLVLRSCESYPVTVFFRYC
jgi:hypothetical protein